jgi:hypothetical protein
MRRVNAKVVAAKRQLNPKKHIKKEVVVKPKK